MLNSLRITTLALGGALFVASAPIPASAQSYSWGTLDHSAEPQVAQASTQQLPTRAAAPAAQSQGAVSTAPVRDLRGTQFDQPGFVAYSWGLVENDNDGHQVAYSWAEVNRKLGNR